MAASRWVGCVWLCVAVCGCRRVLQFMHVLVVVVFVAVVVVGLLLLVVLMC